MQFTSSTQALSGSIYGTTKSCRGPDFSLVALCHESLGEVN